jgi:hypothetical protein
VSAFEQFVMATIIIYVLVSPFLAAWLALRLCSRHWNCTALKQQTLDEWHAQLRAQRLRT